MHRSIILSLIVLSSGCEVEPADLVESADDGEGEGYRTKDEGGPNGDFNYCDGATLCVAGEGDCDSDAQCEAGLVCGENNGNQFGLHWSRDACTDATCANGVMDAGETAVDFGGICGDICNGISGDEEGYCTIGCPCAFGEGDCDTDSECDAGLSCVNNQGERFGLDTTDDVCIDTLGTAELQFGDLVITEIMANPAAVVDGAGEWFEVMNDTNTSIDIQGLVVKKRLGMLMFTVASSIVIEPGGFAVFAKNGNFAVNGGITEDVDYVNNYPLADITDSIVLTAGAVEIDRVFYTAAWVVPNGRSLQLDKFTIDAVGNDDPSKWCDSVALLAAGDRGSPNAINLNCP